MIKASSKQLMEHELLSLRVWPPVVTKIHQMGKSGLADLWVYFLIEHAHASDAVQPKGLAVEQGLDQSG